MQKARNRNMHRRVSCKIRKISVMQEMPGVAPAKNATQAVRRGAVVRGTEFGVVGESRRVLLERLLAKMRNSMICKKKVWWRNKSFLQKARNRNMHRRASCKIRKISVMQEMPGAAFIKYAGNTRRRARKERCPSCAMRHCGTRRCIRRAGEIRRVLLERLLAKMRNSRICKKKT